MDENILQIQSDIERIQEITTLIYQQKYQEAMENFQVLLDQLITLSAKIYEMQELMKIGEFSQNEYMSILTMALNALELKDEVLFADILKYDLTEFLLNVKEQL